MLTDVTSSTNALSSGEPDLVAYETIDQDASLLFETVDPLITRPDRAITVTVSETTIPDCVVSLRAVHVEATASKGKIALCVSQLPDILR